MAYSMSSLADLPELVGFFSYSREDDADSHGALSALRSRIQGELRGLLGRTAKTFRLWQDKEAIPSGTLWETEIKNAVGQAVFIIPIITPTVIASPFCLFELETFLAREAELGRDDLVFPILYIDVPALENSERRKNDAVLTLIAKRQYADWREFRYLDVSSTEVRRAVGHFCADIRNALGRPWAPPKERKQQEEAAAPARAEAEGQRQEAEVKRRTEEERRPKAAEEERHNRKSDSLKDSKEVTEPIPGREEQLRQQLPVVDVKPSTEASTKAAARPESQNRRTTFRRAIISGLSNYWKFSGRATRMEVWLWWLFTFIVLIVAATVDIAFKNPTQPATPEFTGAFLLLVVPTLAVSVRRLHDANLSGWWSLLFLTGIGAIPLVILFCLRGTAGPNRFGQEPSGNAPVRIFGISG
jgi:uncharacterized membrane protein YhaH (DUF805 family)